MSGFHQAVAQGAPGVGLAGAGQPEGQHVDAALHKAALGPAGPVAAAAPGDSVVLEGLPGLARGQPGLPAQPVDAPVAAILSLLLQHFQESCQGIAVSSGGETSHRLGPHGGQLELAAQLADAVLHHAGVRHAHTPAAAS